MLEFKNVTYIYGAGTPFEIKALDDVSIKIEKGKVTGLIGHSGSGKSTLVQLMNALYKPTSGTVLLDGEDINRDAKSAHEARFKVGLVFQYPEYQLFEETVGADIAFGPKNMGLSEGEVRDRVMRAANFVGLSEDILQRSPFELSGGQKRRCAIAGVIAMDPEVLVLDEPAAGLDPGGRREILSGLCKYVEQYNASVILVSHSMEDMALYCDNVVVMYKSRIYKVGTVDEVFSDAEGISNIGLDVPSISKIALALRKKGIDLKGKLYTVEGVRDSIIEYIGRCGK